MQLFSSVASICESLWLAFRPILSSISLCHSHEPLSSHEEADHESVALGKLVETPAVLGKQLKMVQVINVTRTPPSVDLVLVVLDQR
jgi:hypothetical protein